MVLKTPKTKTSVRKVFLPKTVAEMLVQRKAKHAGFGLGFERMVMYLTGISNIRDVLPHPRTVGSADF